MRSIINEILTEGRVEDAKALIHDFFLPDEEHDYSEMVDYLVDNDPSGNNKYLMWMVNRMIDDEEDTVDNTEGALIDLVTDFHSPVVQARVPSKDINHYKNTEELYEAVRLALEKVREKASTQEVAKGTKKIVEDDRWLILHPETKESSCKYGQGTKWCTAMRDGDHYENYTKDGNLYYIIDKSKELGKYYKVALYYNWKKEEEWYDAEDNKLGDNMVEVIESMLPKGYMKLIDNYHDNYTPPIPLKLDPKDLDKFWVDFIRANISQVESHLGNVVTNTGVWVWEKGHFILGDGVMLFNIKEGPLDDEGENTEPNKSLMFFASPWIHGAEGVPLDLEYDAEDAAELVWRASTNVVFGLSMEEIVDKFDIPKEYHKDMGQRSGANEAGWFLFHRYKQYIKDYLSSDHVVKWVKESAGLPGISTWESGSGQSGYRFENVKTAKLANAFTDYIKMAEENGVMATRKDFLEFINKPATPGYFSSFFSAIYAAGIVEKNRKGRQFYYTLGPNYDAYKAGTLKRANE